MSKAGKILKQFEDNKVIYLTNKQYDNSIPWSIETKAKMKGIKRTYSLAGPAYYPKNDDEEKIVKQTFHLNEAKTKEDFLKELEDLRQKCMQQGVSNSQSYVVAKLDLDKQFKDQSMSESKAGKILKQFEDIEDLSTEQARLLLKKHLMSKDDYKMESKVGKILKQYENDLRPYNIGDLVMIAPTVAQRLGLTQQDALGKIVKVDPVNTLPTRRVEIKTKNSTVHLDTKDIVKATH